MANQPQITDWMKTILTKYVDETRLKKSEKTAIDYRYDIARWMEWLADSKVKRISSLRGCHITDYLISAKKAGKADATVCRYYMSLKSFCKFLRRIKAVERDIMEDVEAPRSVSKSPRVLSCAEIRKVIESPDVNTEWGLRDRAMMELLYSSGLRGDELCKLQVEDVTHNSVHIRCGKRGKTRTIPCNKDARYWIERYLTENFAEDERTGQLFITKHGKDITRGLLRKTIVAYAKRVGVEGVTTHTFRHTFATHMLDNGADIMGISKLMGHASIATTQRYIQLSSTMMQVMYDKYQPRVNDETTQEIYT